jgi:hypothetical protein
MAHAVEWVWGGHHARDAHGGAVGGGSPTAPVRRSQRHDHEHEERMASGKAVEAKAHRRALVMARWRMEGGVVAFWSGVSALMGDDGSSELLQVGERDRGWAMSRNEEREEGAHSGSYHQELGRWQRPNRFCQGRMISGARDGPNGGGGRWRGCRCAQERWGARREKKKGGGIWLGGGWPMTGRVVDGGGWCRAAHGKGAERGWPVDPAVTVPDGGLVTSGPR